MIDRKSRSNPFNYILYIKVKQAIYNGDNQVIEFGNEEKQNIETTDVSEGEV